MKGAGKEEDMDAKYNDIIDNILVRMGLTTLIFVGWALVAVGVISLA